jgi:Glycosyl transferase family 2
VLLSAALITRDEERFLDGCLTSIADAVDEIVVVDTGSLDATRDIAVRHGARVLSRPWDGDFAAARNHALDACGGRWILYIDADERLSLDGDLRAVLASATDDVVAATVAFRPTLHSTRFLEHRLMRNRPDVRFRGVIHETMLPDVQRLIERGGRVLEAPASIDHLGYEGDLTPKHRRDLPLLRRQAAADPDRTYLWFQLGLVEAGLGHPDQADRDWSTGVAAARVRGPIVTADLPLFAELALFRLNRAVVERDVGPDAAPVPVAQVADLVADMATTHPDDPLTRWVQANVAMADHRWTDAVDALDELVDHPAADGVHPVLAYDRRLFAELAHHALAMCWLHLDQPARAADELRLALARDATNQEYAVKLALAEARAART